MINAIGNVNDVMTNNLTSAKIAKETVDANEFTKKLAEAQKNNKETTKGNSLSKEAKKMADDQKLKETCREMESLYINQLWKIMQSSVEKSDLIPVSQAEEMMRSMQTEERSKQIARNGGIGIADMMYKQLSQVEREKQDALTKMRIEAKQKQNE